MVDYAAPAEYPYTDLPSTTTPVYADALNDVIDSLVDLGAAGGRVADLELLGSSCRIYANATAQTTTNALEGTTTLNTLDWNDSATLYTPNLGTSVITVNQAGRYLVGYTTIFNAAAVGERVVTITVNGTLSGEIGLTTANITAQSGSRVLNLAASSVLRLRHYTDGGAGVVIRSNLAHQTGLTVSLLRLGA